MGQSEGLDHGGDFRVFNVIMALLLVASLFPIFVDGLLADTPRF